MKSGHNLSSNILSYSRLYIVNAIFAFFAFGVFLGILFTVYWRNQKLIKKESRRDTEAQQPISDGEIETKEKMKA